MKTDPSITTGTTINAAAAPPSPARPVLMVVDDDEGVRASVGVIFEAAFDVLHVGNGARALELITTTPVDLVVLDLNMPGIGGLEILEGIKRHDPYVEVIILTGQATLESARLALQLGAFAYLCKPFEMKEGRQVVDRALNRRRQIQSWQAIENELRQRRIDEEVERVRSSIYASVIHDLNTPLTTTLGLLEMLQLDVEAGNASGPQVAQSIGDAREQVSFCVSIIRRYLGLMRRPAGKVAAADVSQAVEDLKKLIRVHPSVKRNQLLIHVPDECLMVAVNGLDLLQVLLNLTVNALQASDLRHHVEVYCRLLPAEAVARGFCAGPHDTYLFAERLTEGRAMVAITVQDDGPGIPPELLKSIFNSYYTTKPHGHGTGLGLTVVQRIIGNNHGALHLHSVPDEGTAFTVFFPLA